MKTIQINLYSFNELSEETKRKVILNNQYINSDTLDFHYEDAKATVKKFCEVFNIKSIANSFLQPNLSWVDDEILELSNNDLKVHFNCLLNIDTWGESPLTGHSYDNVMLFELQFADEDETFEECIKNAFLALEKYLESEEEYLYSDEAIEETLLDSDKLFTKEGIEFNL